MVTNEIDYLIFVAEKREASEFIKRAKKVSSRIYIQSINTRTISIVITGVGKNSIKRTLKNQHDFLQSIKPKKVFNLGNAGAIKKINASTILSIGTCAGNNGKEKIIIDSSNHIENITVNSIQNKKKLAEQFKNAYCVDMELFHLAKVYPKIISYKIILDTFTFTPKAIFFRFMLPFLVHKNSKLLFKLFVKKYCK